jgi:hypothetical protein
VSEAPKVFISHATEDKFSFVLPFATELRSNGIDAWVDQWEINAGDSLIQKIFEEGIRSASAIVIVLSKISVTKRWVKEELDAALVKRIDHATRLIPLIIEDCEVPVALRATKWVRYDNDVKNVVAEVLRAVFGGSVKPELGSSPRFARSNIPVPAGLDQIDSIVLNAIGQLFVEQGHKGVEKARIVERPELDNLSANQIDESLEILSDHYYVSGKHALGQKFVLVDLRPSGANLVLRQHFPDFDAKARRIVATIVNERLSSNDDIARHLSLTMALVNHVLDDLEARGLIKVAKSLGGHVHIYEVSVRLERTLT